MAASSSEVSVCGMPADAALANYNSAIISSANVAGLTLQYQFEAIPDCPAATSAGWLEADRAQAQSWFPPVLDGDRFYYACWNGNATDLTHKSSILVCREAADGALVYAVDIGTYRIDQASNIFGDTSVVCRPWIQFLTDTIYMVKSNISNIGPELYAINKADGTLKWNCAFYPPEGAGLPDLVTIPGDYSALAGSNMRLGDGPATPAFVTEAGVQKRLVFVGSSSFQNNWTLRYGVLDGFPNYTDSGTLTCIEDTGSAPVFRWRLATCAPNLNPGDTIVRGGNPVYDPFRPGQSRVTLLSQSSPGSYFTQPYFLASPPAPGVAGTTPVAASLTFYSDTDLSTVLQPMWALIGVGLYQDSDRTTAYTYAELVAAWQAEQATTPAGVPIQHIVWAYIKPAVMAQVKAQAGNLGVVYFKYLLSGQQVATVEEAQGLNYYGNSLWAAPVRVIPEKNLVVFGTGQAHSLPLDETLFYQEPDNNYFALKVPVVDAINKYAAGVWHLNKVTNAKRAFIRSLTDLNMTVTDKSPRGRMSYSDAIVGAYISTYTDSCGDVVPGGTYAFGVRMLPCDSYSFLSGSAYLNVFPTNVVDGDISSGVEYFVVPKNKKKNNYYLASTAKAGFVMSLDITNLDDSVLYNHSNLAVKGVQLASLVEASPSSSGGGSSYLGSSKGSLYLATGANQANLPGGNGPQGSDGSYERAVLQNGQVLDFNNSYISAVSIPSGTIVWETPQGEFHDSELVVQNDIVWAVGYSGKIWALDLASGQLKWTYDASNPPLSQAGGQNAPGFSDYQVVVLNSCYTYGDGGGGKYGGVFHVPALCSGYC